MKNMYAVNIVKTINKLGQYYSVWNVFSDFVEMSALAISNAVGKTQFSEREQRYLQVIDKYQKNEQQLFPQMFADLVEALEHEVTFHKAPADVLGVMFHELELHNRFKGQFFTPQSVCNMMGTMLIGGKTGELKERGYITLCEPCCGAGTMILGFANAMKDNGLNYCRQLYVEATDTDLTCVHMCYLQLSLYGIPATVIHGNSLTLQEYSRWYTPVYVANAWCYRLLKERVTCITNV